MMTEATPSTIRIRRLGPNEVERRLASAPALAPSEPDGALWRDPRWMLVFRDGLQHPPYLLEAWDDDRLVGWLPLSLVASRLFGRFLVSMPYLNSGGIQAETPVAAEALASAACDLADELAVKHLELRHEHEVTHARLPHALRSKVHMRFTLPPTHDDLWRGFKSKLKNQLRKGEQQGFEVEWGGAERLSDFYEVFSRNMRDLGTPVFARELFASIQRYFPQESEFCVVKLRQQPVAVALLLHGSRVTEVPSASSLREFNGTNANMHMYWHLLQRAVTRGSAVFDFGRSSLDSGTYRFKEQWGALPAGAVWQYYVRKGEVSDMRPESGKYRLAIRIWKKLPLPLTRWLGPQIVRGIP